MENFDSNHVHIYNCSCCGEIGLVLYGQLEKYPIRKTDQSFILNKEKNHFKLCLNSSQTIYIKYSEGLEKRTQFTCKVCSIPIAYESNNTQYTFILKEALFE